MSDSETRQQFSHVPSVYSTIVLRLKIIFALLTLIPALSLVYAQTAVAEAGDVQGNSRAPGTPTVQERQGKVSRWPDEVSNTDQSIVLTTEEQAWLAQAHTIRVRFINYPPFMIMKRGGEPGGISIDYLSLIAKRTGIRIRYVFSDEPFSEALDGLISHQGPDMIITLMRTPERERDVSFSNDYFVTPNVVFARADAGAIQGPGDLIGKEIAVPRDYVVHEAIESAYPGVGLKLFDSASGALEALATGNADAYIGNLTIASYLILNNGLSNLVVAAPSGLEDHAFSFGSRNDWPELSSIINKGLQTISPEEGLAIRNEYLAIQYEHEIRFGDVVKWALIVLAATLGIILVVLFWNWSLRKGVVRSTVALQNEINERKQATLALVNSEAKYRGLVDNAMVGVFTSTLDGKLIFVNEALARMLDYASVEQALADGSLVHWRDPGRRAQMLAELQRHGSVTNYEMKATSHAGRNLDAMVSARLIDGCITGIAMDITEQKKAQEALQESEKSLLKAQAMARMGRWEWSIPDNRISWSDEVYRIYGIDAGTPVTYERLMQAIHPEDREYHDKHTAEWLKNRSVEPFEYRIIRPDGSVRYIYGTGEVECDNADEPIRFMGILQDVTESELKEIALTQSEARFRATFEQAAVGIAHVAPDGHFLRINRKYCDIVGYSQEEMLQLTFQRITHAEDLDADLGYVNQLLASEIATYSMEKRYIRKDGEIVWVNLTVSLVKSDSGQPQWFVVVVEEITKRKQHEVKLHDYQQRLKGLTTALTHTEDRERRKIATELHDHVGQSLAVMRMQLAVAKKETKGRKVNTVLDEVSDSLREAIRDTRNITAELSSPTLNELGLSAAIADWLKENIGDRHGLQTRFEDDGEPKRLSQDASAIAFRSVRELLMNVVKHASANRVTVSIQNEDSVVKITVEDDGVGMPPGTGQEPASATGGFGLFSIVERMHDLGGSLSIESQPGEGVRAILTLPLETGS